MAHVVFLPKKTPFYPFSYRPAVCLTSELPPEILQPSCYSIAATLKTYCTPCTPIWAHVSGLPLTSDDFAANSSIQRRGLSTSRVAMQIQLY
jgi:hypothetical protein